MIIINQQGKNEQQRNSCFIENASFRAAKTTYDPCYDMRAGLNRDDRLDQVMLTK